MDELEASRARHGAHSGTRYAIVLVALLALTALSFAMHYAPLGGALGAAIALTIAGIKVTLVALVFMELKQSLAATRIVAVTTVMFVVILCVGVIGDVGFR